MCVSSISPSLSVVNKMTFQPFISTSRRGDEWFCVGKTSDFPNIRDSGEVVLADCQNQNMRLHGCKVFLAPEKGDRAGQATQLSDDPKAQLDASLRKGDQVLVFQYKGRFHAIDNVSLPILQWKHEKDLSLCANKKCPHSSYPLSNGTPFDIEDFGIALSAGISCPKHGWTFDLFSGQADRGTYKLKLWEVQVRDCAGGEDVVKEIWIRRKQRMG